MRKNRLIMCLLLAGGLASLAGMAGCYERVVSAKGPGAMNYQVQESYQGENKIDNWFWKGDSKK
jgi:hypothetical protein